MEYLRQAGVKAFERSANREAAAAFEQALNAIEHLPQTRKVTEQTVDLCLAMRPCVTPLGDMKRLLASVDRAAALTDSLGNNPRREALICGYQAAALTNLGRTEEASSLARRGWSTAQSLDDPLLRVCTRFFLGQTQVRLAMFREAIETFERDVGLSTDRLIELAARSSTGGTLDARSALSSQLFTNFECSFAYAELGAFDAAVERAEEVERIAQAVGLVYFRALAEMARGGPRLQRGETSVAIPFLERSLQLGENADFPGAIILAACGLGQAYNLTERAQDSIALLERAWGLAEAGGFLHFGAICLMHLADAYSLTGQQTKALATIDRALTVGREGGFRAREAWALYLQGNILGRGPEADTAAARHAHQASLTLADELGMRPLSAHCHLGLGQLHATLGDAAKAREHLERALALYREMGMQHWPEQAEAALRAVN